MSPTSLAPLKTRLAASVNFATSSSVCSRNGSKPAMQQMLKTFQSSDSSTPYFPALAGSFHRSQPWSSAASRLILSVLTTKL
jgi:hypothetical protein